MVKKIVSKLRQRIEQKFPDLQKPGVRLFFIRLFLFFAIVALVFILHPYLEVRYGYELKGGDPYARYLALGMVALTIFLSGQKIKSLPAYAVPIKERILFFLSSLVCFVLPANPFFVSVDIDKIMLQYLWLFLGTGLLFMGIFGRILFHYLKNEIVLLVLLLIPTLLLTFVVDLYWKYPARAVFSSLTTVFSWLNLPMTSKVDTFSITVKTFGVAIGPACAGFYSLFTFIALFALSLSGAYAQGRIIWRKAFFYLILALVLLFLWNIVRVAAILLVGAYWSPAIALKVFHESLSALFLVGLFVYYLSHIVPKITRTRSE